MKNAFWLIFFVSCFFSVPNFLAQTPKIAHTIFTKKDGLEIDHIQTIVMDDDGFLWLGGSSLEVRAIIKSNKTNTLQRFDGANFHNIRLPIKHGTIINIDQIYKRKDGKFYIKLLSESGDQFYLFDPRTMLFTSFNITKNKDFARTYSKIYNFNEKEYFLFQRDSTIYLSEINEDLTLSPIFSFNYTKARFLLDSSTVLLIDEDFIVISDDNFPIHFFDWSGKLLSKMPDKQFIRKENSHIKKPYIESYFKKDDTYFVFFNDNKGLQKIDNQSYSFVPASHKVSPLYEHLASFNDVHGNPIICTSNTNFSSFSFANDELTKNSSPSIFQNSSSMAIFSEDVTNNVWIGNGVRELHYLKFPSDKMKTFLPDYAMRSLISLDSLNYLVATETDGWFTIDKKTLNISPYQLTEKGIEVKPNSARNIIKDDSTLWSNDNGNILEIDTRTQTLQSYRHYPVLCLEKLNDSTLIYGTSDFHLMEFNTKSKQHHPILETKGVAIYDIAISHNLLVAATDKGVFTYDFKTKKETWRETTAYVNDPFFLMVDYIDKLGFVLGSREGDIIIFNQETQSFNPLYKDEYKAGIATLILDNKTLWINTFNGIVALNLEDETVFRYSETDGLSNNEANRYSALKTPNGIFVGTLKGLNFFHPSQLKPVKKIASLKLLKLRHYDSEANKVVDVYNISKINKRNPIVIPTEYKELSLDFGLTNNTAPNEIRYRYKLGDTDWININQQQSLSFPSLSAGKYSLEIEALNFSSNKIGETLVLLIDSKEFFYKKWWFIVGLSLIVISILLYLLQQSQLRQTLQQNFARDLISSQEKERKRIARDLHDSVGQRLTLIKRKTQNQKEAELTTMTNDVLEEVRSISRGLYPANLKVLGLTESIKQLAYEIDEQTDLFITLELENIDAYFNDESALNIYRFVQESFSNILKHAKAKEVSVRTKKDQNLVILCIEDNGIGFIRNEKNTRNSLGLKTLEERISVVNGKLEILTKHNKGTQLIATFPLT